MKKYEDSPITWFFAVVLMGWLSVEFGSIETFAIIILAVILSKQIEIINKIKK